MPKITQGSEKGKDTLISSMDLRTGSSYHLWISEVAHHIIYGSQKWLIISIMDLRTGLSYQVWISKLTHHIKYTYILESIEARHRIKF